MGSPRTPAKNDSVCGCPSRTVTRGAGADGKNVAGDVYRPGIPAQRAEQQVRAGQADHSGVTMAREHSAAADDLGHDRADSDERDLIVGGRMLAMR